MDPNIKKVKRKNGDKRYAVTVLCDSFFSMFDQVRMPKDEDMKKGKLAVIRKDVKKPTLKEKAADDFKSWLDLDTDSAEEEPINEDLGMRMDQDYQLALDIKDELVPLAFEYFLDLVDEGKRDEDKENEEHLKDCNT